MKPVARNRNSKLTSFLRKALMSETRGVVANQRLLDGRKWVGTAAAVGGIFISSLASIRAADFTWADTTNVWDANGSWTTAGFPNNAVDTALFGPEINPAVAPVANITANNIVVGTVTFGPGAQAYNINTNAFTLTLVSAVVNNSGNVQTFNRNGAADINISATLGSGIVVNNNSSAGRVQFFTGGNAGAATLNNNASNGSLEFNANSNAGSATINNLGDTSFTIFNATSSAGSSTIYNTGTDSSTVFTGFSSGGTATIINGASGALFIENLTNGGTTIGSIEGGGFVVLGANTLDIGGNGKSTTFAGEISGTGNLIKSGPGRLNLTGINIFTGDTYVRGGGLYVNGSTTSANTYVSHGALLGGTGFIYGNVFNHGVVKPGNSPGTLHVSGNYTQYSDGDLRIEIGSKSNYGRLQVGGVANLDGTVTAVAVNGYKPKKGDKYTVLTANGGVHGEFDEVRTEFPQRTILKLDATYKSNSVILEFKRGSFLDFAKTYNQRSVARALDKVSDQGKESRLLNHLDYVYVENLPGDFDRIAPEELASSTEIAMSYANVTNGNISRHNDELRTSNGGYLASSLSAQGSTIAYSGPIKFRTGAAGPSGNEGKESKESKEVFEPENRWGAFLTGVGEWVDVSGDGNARGYDINTGGFTLGIDYKITPNLAVGVLAGYVGSKADLTDNGRVLVNGGKLGLYATYFTGGFYVDAAATGGYNSYDTRRKGLGGNVYGDTEGGEISAMFGTGYDVKVGNWTFGPTANVQYTYVGIDDFREHGSLAPLDVQDQDQESFRTSVGFRTSYDIKLRGGGILIRPELKLAWQHEFADDAYSIDARFRQGGDIFSVDGPDMGRDSLLLGAGFVVLFSERVSTYLYYDAQLARTNYESHSISGGVRIAF